MKKWKIKNKVYLMPDTWDKEKVLKWCNDKFRVCEFCGKVDVSINHYNNCNPEYEANKNISLWGI